MMAQSKDIVDREPTELEGLLPFHAAGTLSAGDARRVEAALARDPDLARQYAVIQDEYAETILLNESLGAPSARAMKKLFDAIDAGLPALFARDTAALVPVIAESCRIKAKVVESDERESGPRRVLNFGHTAGHALEAVTKYRRFRHGEAVAYGMLTAAELALGRQVITGADRDALQTLIMKMGPLPPVGDLEASQIVEAVSRDKKVVDGTLHYVRPTSIGDTTIATDVSGAELQKALRTVGLRGT